jgi:arginyl-tRNA synthetase
MEDALSFEGNTGPYVQYTYARCCSVLEKAGEIDESNLKITAPEENDLIQIMSKFPEKVNEAIHEYEPSIVTRYILELAGAYNRFYHNCKILTADDSDVVNTRLAITKAVKTVLGNAFELICLRKTEKI